MDFYEILNIALPAVYVVVGAALVSAGHRVGGDRAQGAQDGGRPAEAG